MTLVERCEKMINELGIPVTEFSRRVELAPSSYYRWRAGEIKLSEKTAARIEAWIKHYGF